MILIVDDDSTIRTSLKVMLTRAGYEAETADRPKAAMELVRSAAPIELVLMDMNYSLSTTGDEGMVLLKQVKLFRPEVPVILMTAWGSIDLAVKGMRAGAFDFVTKPWVNIVLMQRIETALGLGEKAQTAAPSRASNDSGILKFPNGPKDTKDFGIIGNSTALRSIMGTLLRVAPSNASVLITGESGTGKELIAEAVHRMSRRADKPFVKVNLGGMTTSLFGSEMFGHKRGAFTDAVADREGRFAMANGGTIFLDEIGDLDMASQVKLLRVLQDQTYQRLGDSKTYRADVRVVCATNADLPRRIAEGRFREDLFYRISLITLQLPPLRERAGDIPLLVAHFAERFAHENRIPVPSFTPDAIAWLQSQPFPGNIRELKNLVERTILVSGKQEIAVLDLAPSLSALSAPSAAFPGSVSVPASRSVPCGAAAGILTANEQQLISETLAQCDGNISRAAAQLGISRQALYRKLEKYGIAK